MSPSPSPSSAEQVTYSFVSFYYGKLHENPTELYQAYTKDATLTHSKIPSNNNDQEIINKSIEFEQVSSIQEIEKFYSKSNIKNCKIRVSSIDYQAVSLNNSVLISIIGELALTDESPVYRFTQSFILVPGKVANAYDISNDIFRLIPDDDFELNQDEEIAVVEEKPKVEQEVQLEDETPKINGEVNEEKKEESPEAVEIEAVEEPKQVETAEEEKEVEVVDEETPEIPEDEPKKNEEEEEKEQGKEKEEVKQDEKQTEQEPAKPVKKSWAQISSSAPVVSTNVAKPKPKSKATTPTIPNTDTTKESKESKEPSPKPPLQNITNQKASRKKFEHLYPVLIKGTEYLTAQDLKIALDQEFGKTTKVEPRGTYALADFELEKSQQKALATKNLKIGSSTILIEQKTKRYEFKDRKPNTNNNTNQNNNKNKDGPRQNNNANYNQKKKNTNK